MPKGLVNMYYSRPSGQRNKGKRSERSEALAPPFIKHDLVKGSGHAKPPDGIALAGRSVSEGVPRQQ